VPSSGPIDASGDDNSDNDVCESRAVKEALFLKSTRVRLRNKRGLHARAAAKFATLAQTFDANIEVTSCNHVCQETVEGDSIMELLMLGSACGEDISITAKGPDAEKALLALEELVADRFGEGE
jgi:phosphocarrier protein